MAATAFAVAVILFSCKGRIKEVDGLDFRQIPLQSVTDMYIVQTKNGKVEMRTEAPVMQCFRTDTLDTDFFPEGFAIYGYSATQELETVIVADQARHLTPKRNGNEVWEAYGNVIIQNILQQETMETDTLYWDRTKGRIWTRCYIKMYSPDGFMQGYGMESDEHARNSTIIQPFNSFGYVVKDSQASSVDSANFIGPFLKK